MSWDLLVATHDRPSAMVVDELLHAQDRYAAQGRLQAPAANVLVTRMSRAGTAPAFTLDGPHQVDVEDLPELLAGAILSPRYLVEMSSPAAATSADRTLAKKIAKRLAENLRGAVYDPQAEALVWPRKRRRDYAAASEKQRIRLVTLAWYFRLCQPELVVELLRKLRAACPEALPRRYGDYEPFQHTMQPGDDARFVAFWRDLEARETSKMLHWKAQSPCFGGGVCFPDQRERYPSGQPVGIPGATKCIRIDIDFDGRALHGDARWSSAVVDLLRSTAEQLEAFYAAGYVRRNVIAKRSLWFDDESEDCSMPFSDFTGLPAKPTWLAWFGPSYARHVAEHLQGCAERRSGGAWFFQGGPEPMDADELAARFPSLPRTLLATERPNAPVGEPRVVAAELIPMVNSTHAGGSRWS